MRPSFPLTFQLPIGRQVEKREMVGVSKGGPARQLWQCRSGCRPGRMGTVRRTASSGSSFLVSVLLLLSYRVHYWRRC